MIRYSMAALTAGAALSTAAPALAQTPKVAPGPMYPRVGVMGYAPALRPGGTSLTNREEPGLLRRALPDGDIRDWIAEDDPSIGLVRDGEAASDRVALFFDIGADGRPTGCRVEDGETSPYAMGLCERMGQRMTLVPALDLAGRRVPDAYFIYVWFERSAGTPPTRLVDHMSLPPAPAPPPPGGWPPRNGRTSAVVEGVELLAGGGRAPEASTAPWASLDVSVDDRGRTVCRIEASSGDGGFDGRACNAARRGRYAFPGAQRSWERHVSIHFARQEGRARAVLPVHERWTAPVATPESLAAIRSALPQDSGTAPDRVRLRLEIDAAGRATQCLVTATSGSDEIDLAACRLTLDIGRFTPAEDIFGRPRPSALYDAAPRAARQLNPVALGNPASAPYIERVRVRPDYGDKRACNKRTGPGCDSRRLHHFLPCIGGRCGAD